MPMATPPKPARSPATPRAGSEALAPRRPAPEPASAAPARDRQRPDPPPAALGPAAPIPAAGGLGVPAARAGDRPAGDVAVGTAASPLVGSATAEPRPLPAPTLVPSAASQATAPAAPPEDPIAAENRSFMAALARWHRDHKAADALAMLELHEQRFPHGQMRLEARLLRAEILLQQAREREALALLDGVTLTGLPRGRELLTVRGELRIKHGRCADGRSDLGDVLAKGSTDSLGRRAAAAILLCP
jgi:hypothetical protein